MEEASVCDDALRTFTPRAQQILGLARKEADQYKHNFVGTEHVLLALSSVVKFCEHGVKPGGETSSEDKRHFEPTLEMGLREHPRVLDYGIPLQHWPGPG